MKTMIKYLLAVAALLSIGAIQKAEAQSADPVIPLVYNNTTGYWDLTSMPSYNVKLVVEYYSELSETTDNLSTLSSWDKETKDIVLVGRKLWGDGYYNTFAVPFEIPKSKYDDYKLTQVKKLTGSSYDSGTGKLTLNFADEDTKIEAGKPYLVKVSADVENPTFDGVVVSKDPSTVQTTAVYFVPTLGKTLIRGYGSLASNNKSVLMLGESNKLYNPKVVNDTNDTTCFLKGFRAYFQLLSVASNASEFVLDFGGGETTSISLVDDGRMQVEKGATYDLQGRRIDDEPAQKGVYIKNGKKVIVK